MFIHDYSLVPAALEDIGHYLFKPELKEKVVVREMDSSFWRKELVEKLERKKPVLQGIRLIDTALGIVSLVDSLIWDKECGKFILHLSEHRLAVYCPPGQREICEDIMARWALYIVSKQRLSEWIEDSYCKIGNRMVTRSDEEQHRVDVRQARRTLAVLNGLEYLTVDGSGGSLYPNLKADYTGTIFEIDACRQKEKMQTAIDMKDISMVWQCGVKRRDRLHRKGVYRWDDPRFLCFFQEMIPSRIHIVSRMVEMTEDVEYPPLEVVRTMFPSLRDTDLSRWMFVDFETDFQKCIYMMGWATTENHGWEWGSAITLSSERELMDRIYTCITRHREEGGRIAYYFAEDRFWKERCVVHGLVENHEFYHLFSDALDLHRVMERLPILIRGVFSFKLKAIADGLYRHGLVPICQPEGCADGAESVRIAQRYFTSHDESLKTILENYNRFDCQILLEIVHFLRKLYF